MYRNTEGEGYQLVSGSLYQLTLQDSIPSYTCLDRLLEESEYFAIEQGDMVAACWSSDENRVEMFSRNVFRTLEAGGGSCGQNVIDGTSRILFREIFLSAYISEFITGVSSNH